MAYKMFSPNKTYVKYRDCEDGDVLVEGIYIGKEVSQKYKNLQYTFKQTVDGSLVCLNATTSLNKWIDAEVSEGDQVFIRYVTRGIVKTGAMAGKEYIQLEMGVDKERKQDLSAPKKTNWKMASSDSVDSAVDEGIL